MFPRNNNNNNDNSNIGIVDYHCKFTKLENEDNKNLTNVKGSYKEFFRINNSVFDSASITYSSFSNITNCNFKNANLQNGKFNDFFEACDFTNANLSDATFKFDVSMMNMAQYNSLCFKDANLTFSSFNHVSKSLFETIKEAHFFVGVSISNIVSLLNCYNAWVKGTEVESELRHFLANDLVKQLNESIKDSKNDAEHIQKLDEFISILKYAIHKAPIFSHRNLAELKTKFSQIFGTHVEPTDSQDILISALKQFESMNKNLIIQSQDDSKQFEILLSYLELPKKWQDKINAELKKKSEKEFEDKNENGAVTKEGAVENLAMVIIQLNNKLANKDITFQGALLQFESAIQIAIQASDNKSTFFSSATADALKTFLKNNLQPLKVHRATISMSNENQNTKSSNTYGLSNSSDKDL